MTTHLQQQQAAAFQPYYAATGQQQFPHVQQPPNPYYPQQDPAASALYTLLPSGDAPGSPGPAPFLTGAPSSPSHGVPPEIAGSIVSHHQSMQQQQQQQPLPLPQYYGGVDYQNPHVQQQLTHLAVQILRGKKRDAAAAAGGSSPSATGSGDKRQGHKTNVRLTVDELWSPDAWIKLVRDMVTANSKFYLRDPSSFVNIDGCHTEIATMEKAFQQLELPNPPFLGVKPVSETDPTTYAPPAFVPLHVEDTDGSIETMIVINMSAAVGVFKKKSVAQAYEHTYTMSKANGKGPRVHQNWGVAQLRKELGAHVVGPFFIDTAIHCFRNTAPNQTLDIFHVGRMSTGHIMTPCLVYGPLSIKFDTDVPVSKKKLNGGKLYDSRHAFPLAMTMEEFLRVMCVPYALREGRVIVINVEMLRQYCNVLVTGVNDTKANREHVMQYDGAEWPARVIEFPVFRNAKGAVLQPDPNSPDVRKRCPSPFHMLDKRTYMRLSNADTDLEEQAEPVTPPNAKVVDDPPRPNAPLRGAPKPAAARQLKFAEPDATADAMVASPLRQVATTQDLDADEFADDMRPPPVVSPSQRVVSPLLTSAQPSMGADDFAGSSSEDEEQQQPQPIRQQPKRARRDDPDATQEMSSQPVKKDAKQKKAPDATKKRSQPLGATRRSKPRTTTTTTTTTSNKRAAGR